MDKLVIDSSVVAKWFVPESYSVEALRVLTGYETAALDLLAPDLLSVELASILWKKHLFQGLALADAELFLVDYTKLNIPLASSIGLLNDAFHIAVSYRRSVYDALYVALSIQENCRFVTADEKLFNALKSAFPNIVWLAQWP